MPNPRANRPLTLDQVTADLKSLSQPAFYPRVGNIQARGMRSPQPQPMREQTGPEMPQWGDSDLSVPTQANRAMSQRLSEQDVLERSRANANMSPLEKAGAAMQAARLVGSGLTQLVMSMPTRIRSGDQAADEYIAENIYQPTIPKATEYVGDFGEMMEQLETKYKLPPIMPELLAFQEMAGPAARQVAKTGAKAGRAAGSSAAQMFDQSMRMAPEGQAIDQGFAGGGLLKGIKAARKGALNAERSMPARGALSFADEPVGGPSVIKEKGGNWLGGNVAGNVDRALNALKTDTVAGKTPAERIPMHEELLLNPELNDESRAIVQRHLDTTKGEAAVDQWIANNVGNYIKKDMATPTDPVRLMFERRAQEIEAQFQTDMSRAERTRARAEAETDPRRRANLIRQAAQQEDQAKFDRDFANEHITHLPKEDDGIDRDTWTNLRKNRREAGFDPEGMAQSEPAKLWEGISDDVISVTPASRIQGQREKYLQLQAVEKTHADMWNQISDEYLDQLKKTVNEKGAGLTNDQIERIAESTPIDEKARAIGKIDEFKKLQSDLFNARQSTSAGYLEVGEENPWIAKLDPESKVYSAYIGDLGIDHVIDVIKQDVAAGRIRPEQLNKLSMDQAIQRTSEFNMEQAKKMREAVIKNTEGFPIHKEYADEGYKWVELSTPKMPDVLPEGWSEPVQKGNALQTVSPEGKIVLGFNLPDLVKNIYRRHPETPGNPEKALEDALKYEGDTMGHCVGGYCPDVIAGKSRIYSLRDKRGEPHVTVEVNPASVDRGTFPVDTWFKSQPKEMQDAITEAGYTGYNIRHSPQFKEAEKNAPPSIKQIKGKGNARPVEKYDTYTQDFVRSGEWSDVGDLKNTGLIDTQRLMHESVRQKYSEHGIPNPRYMTAEEFDNLPNPTTLQGIEKLPPEGEGMKHGGSVHISDNPDTMMMELGDKHFALGGVADVVKMVKANRARQAAQAAEKELALPAKLPRAKPRSKEELRPLAQEMSEATRGDFYRPEPSKSINPAGKSFDQWKAEQDLAHDIRPTAKRKDLPRSDIEKQKGMVKMGISGDTTAAEQVLHRAGPYELDISSPQHGGPLYGLGGEGAWASNNPVSATVQQRINEISEAYGGSPILGQYLQMGKLGSDFALHFADANLRAIDFQKMSKGQIEKINQLIRKGSNESGPRPSFPGIEDKDSAYLHFAFDPKLRKHFNSMMRMPSVTKKYGLPDGRVIHHAITEPELRDLPVTTTGFSQMELAPGFDPEKLLLSEHPTYSHVIPNKPGTSLTRTQYHTPAQVEFPDVYEYLTETAPVKSRPQDMTRMYQTSTPRQIIDQQHIDEIKMFEELMKEYGGKKKGGAITAKRDGQKFKPGRKPDQILKHGQAMPRGKDPEVDIGQMVPQMSVGGKLSKVALEAIQRMKAMRPEIAAKSSLEQKALTENTAKYARDIQPFTMTEEEVAAEIKRLESKGMAGGGAINADDLILEERKL